MQTKLKRDPYTNQKFWVLNIKYRIKFIDPCDFDWEVTLECVDGAVSNDPFLSQHLGLLTRTRSIDAYNEFGRRVHYTDLGIDLGDTVKIEYEVDANGLILAENWYTLSVGGVRYKFPS